MTVDFRNAIRVASIPAAHPYVENLSTPDGGFFVGRLTDPLPAGAPAGQWWPPVMLDAAWVRTHAEEFDVMHLHFGSESFSTDRLRDLVAALRETGRPLVYTVHDLVNPQLSDQARHLEHLALLVEAADELLTLTDASADEVELRYGRRPEVVPHPHLLPLDAAIPSGTPSVPYVIGVNLRDLRPNIDGERIADCLIRTVEILRGSGIEAVGRIHLREVVRDPEAAARIVERVGRASASSTAGEPAAIELVRGARLDDDGLAATLADLDVALLPYRHGTHSGWVELCYDLGVPVAGPAVGHAARQHPDEFALFDPADPASLVRAVLDLVTGRASRPGTGARRILTASRRVARRLALHDIEARHRDTYERALSRVIA